MEGKATSVTANWASMEIVVKVSQIECHKFTVRNQCLCTYSNLWLSKTTYQWQDCHCTGSERIPSLALEHPAEGMDKRDI